MGGAPGDSAAIARSSGGRSISRFIIQILKDAGESKFRDVGGGVEMIPGPDLYDPSGAVSVQSGKVHSHGIGSTE